MGMSERDKIEARDKRAKINEQIEVHSPAVKRWLKANPTKRIADFPGLGVVKCYVCGLPVRDHPVAERCQDYDPSLDRSKVPGSFKARYR